MEIYAEYLFIENFAAGAVILWLTGKLCGCQIGKARLIVAAGICGIYAFVIFFPAIWIAAGLLGKLLFSALIVFISFPCFPGKSLNTRKRLRRWLRMWAIFCLVSFLMGGLTIAGMYLWGMRGVSANGAIYIHSAGYVQVVVGIALTGFLGNTFAKWITERRTVERVFREAVVVVSGTRFQMRAMIDTGNFLREPLTGKPVAIVCQSAAEEILKSGVAGRERFTVIPYRSIGSKNGVLTGFRVDRVIAEEKSIENMILAVYDGEFAQAAEDQGYRLLLHRELFEGGIAVNG